MTLSRLWHHLLLYSYSKLERYGSTAWTMRWVENQLHSRAWRAEVSSLKSRWLVVTSNMPQGLILGQIMLTGFTATLDAGMDC